MVRRTRADGLKKLFPRCKFNTDNFNFTVLRLSMTCLSFTTEKNLAERGGGGGGDFLLVKWFGLPFFEYSRMLENALQLHEKPLN